VNLQFYYIVLAPYDRSYKNEPQWYMDKGLDFAHRLFSKHGKTLVITRETLHCSKVHINVLVASTTNLVLLYHKKALNKYKVSWCEAVQQNSQNLERVLDYIFKDARERYFELYKDYKIFLPK